MLTWRRRVAFEPEVAVTAVEEVLAWFGGGRGQGGGGGGRSRVLRVSGCVG